MSAFLRIMLDKKTPCYRRCWRIPVMLPSHPARSEKIVGNGAYQFTGQQGDTVRRNPWYFEGNANLFDSEQLPVCLG